LEAISALQGISFAKTTYEKLSCLVIACHNIVDCVKRYYLTNPAPSNQSITVTADYLLPIFSFILVKSQIPFTYSECCFVLEFLPEGLYTAQEAFAAATFRAAVNNLDKMKMMPNGFLPMSSSRRSPNSSKKEPIRKASVTPEVEKDLISFDEETFGLPSGSPQQNRPQPDSFPTLNRVEKEYIEVLKQTKTVDSFNQLAMYYNTKGNLLKAIDYCNQSLKMDRKNVIAMQNLAVYSNMLLSSQQP